ncbi:MAG: alpha/beta fold hydrolase [Burkholderiales bacterium]|nr:alpha/beta fold hydrolase [Burkholderiales bacterium]
MRITKHFVTVGTRRVHYLRAGSGPAVAMLHASPCSAKVMRPLMALWAERFTVFAFDTPGFGLSDKLPIAAPTVEDFADALAETLAALGIEQVATYGRHTGASIAVEFAARHPARTAMALADGFAIFPKRYTDAQLAAYLEPLVPAWDGGHLLHLWFRYRDQHVFWPWNNQTPAARADTDVPDLDFLHRGVVELLEAGDDYRIGYAAPFRHRELGVLDDLRVPVCFGNRPGDSMMLTHHLYPERAWTAVMPREFDAASLAERAILEKHPARGAVPPAPPCAPLPGRSTPNFVDIDGAQVLVRSVGDAGGAVAPLLLIHHAPGSTALYESFLAQAGREHPVLAFDLPGHGESDPLPGNPQDVGTWADVAEKVLARLGVAQVRLRGHNGGAAVAVELAHRLGARALEVTLDAPFFLADADRARFAGGYAPAVTPTWDGSHWLRAWHHLRDSELWWPWFERTRGNARASARIEPAELTLRVREAMKQPASYEGAWRANVGYAWRERLAGLRAPLRLAAADDDTFAHLLPAVRAQLSQP